MPRAKAPPRVKGPYSERGGSRYRIRVCDSTGHRDLYFATLHEAQAGFTQATRELAQSSQSRQLGKILDEYTSDRVHRGRCGAQSAYDERLRLRRWLAGSLHKDISKLTLRRHPTVDCRAGQRVPGQDHERGPQPRSSRGSAPTLAPTSRRKSVGGISLRRNLERPSQTSTIAAHGRPKGLPGCWVPVVCPHSLRGLWAAAGVRSGALSHAVAAALGHGSFKVTAKHYVQPGTLDGARTEQLVKLLDLKAAGPGQDPTRLHAEQLLSSLPRETLARLLELASRAPESSV